MKTKKIIASSGRPFSQIQQSLKLVNKDQAVSFCTQNGKQIAGLRLTKFGVTLFCYPEYLVVLLRAARRSGVNITSDSHKELKLDNNYDKALRQYKNYVDSKPMIAGMFGLKPKLYHCRNCDWYFARKQPAAKCPECGSKNIKSVRVEYQPEL